LGLKVFRGGCILPSIRFGNTFMQTAADYAQERSELATILASGIFNRAPNLAMVLTYVCEKHFAGAADQIKEYNIAVEALRRPTGFDQKRNSIVRVEAHRLRRRLREYYDSDGAAHALRIEIPAGQYAPRFLPQALPQLSLSQETLVMQPELEPVAEVAATALVPAPSAVFTNPRSSRKWIGAGLGFLLFCGLGIAVWKAPAKGAGPNASATAHLLNPAVGAEDIRILAGHLGANYTDRLGRVWQSDRYFQGGHTFESLDHHIMGTREPRIYQCRREGDFSYDIPLAPGTYELRLHFAETLYGENNVAGGGETSRVFNVLINGVQALREFDVISEVGASTADVRAFKDIGPAADGKLHLKFEPSSNPPQLSAIEITPGTAGRFRPIRMVALDRPFTDTQGRVWEPDTHARSGLLATRTHAVGGSADPELFRGERFGNLRYAIPVPPGHYGLTLYFAEAWFGPGTPAGGGVGSRVFDILCNGVALRRDFDIFQEARGAWRATMFTVHGLEPDAQGKLNLALVPIRNYASINAIEVVDETRGTDRKASR
jgi:hypothetical protein